MSFFQNVFDQEFRGNLVLGDRAHILTFRVEANTNSSHYMVAHKLGPYNLTGVVNLTINYSFRGDFTAFTALIIDVSGATPSATTASEVVTALNANAIFADLFTATLEPTTTSSDSSAPPFQIAIRSKKSKEQLKAYISNSEAETKLGFNNKSPVAELPTYFARHTIANSATYTDGVNLLIELDETDAVVDIPIIQAAGFDESTMKADWELMSGRSGLFSFQNLTIDGSDRITEVVEYQAGAKEGDLAKKVKYVYTGANDFPDQITEEPYTLTSGDLVTP